MQSTQTNEVPVLHNYDGIQEYDNPLPGWWKWIFWITIVLTPMYIMYFHAGAPGRTLDEMYQTAITENTKKQYGEIGDLASDEATMVKYLKPKDPKDEKWISVGKSIFRANCISCHGPDGGGNAGPNLCDDNYKHVKQLPDIIKVVSNGVAGGAMPGWSTRLTHKNDIVLVSVYVASLRGTKPATAKAPDGNVIPPWPNE